MNGFISYSHLDHTSLGDFRTHIRAIERAFSTAFWADTRIAPGFYWNRSIEKAIEDSEIFILLVSPGFIASDYIYDHEIPAIKARHLKGALVLPVVLKRCMWQFIANALQALPMHKGHIKTRVLIIEDEAFIAEDMSSLFRAVGHEIIGVASTSSEAITLAETNYPGLIIADIQLRDGSSGLAAVAEILDSISVPVIFVTAYPERFLTASRPEPAFLISKPYQPAMLLAVASQALFFQRNARRRAKRK